MPKISVDTDSGLNHRLKEIADLYLVHWNLLRAIKECYPKFSEKSLLRFKLRLKKDKLFTDYINKQKEILLPALQLNAETQIENMRNYAEELKRIGRHHLAVMLEKSLLDVMSTKKIDMKVDGQIEIIKLTEVKK